MKHPHPTAQVAVNFSIARAYVRTLLHVVSDLNSAATRDWLINEIGPDPDTAHSHSSLQQLCFWLDEATRRTGIPSVGVRYGHHVRPGTFGALGYAAMNADSVAGALSTMAQFGQTVVRLGCNAMSTELSADGLSIEWNPSRVAEADHAQLAESVIASVFHFGLWITGSTKPLGKVEFRHPAPTDTHIHHQLFPNGVKFDAKRTRIVLPVERLSTPLTQADPQLHDHMKAQLSTHLAWSATQQQLHQQLRPIIQALLPEGHSSLEAAAQRMCISVRTLQRRLDAEGMAFRQVVDQVRRELAVKHISNPRLSLLEVAAMVGFAEQSSFTRAYRQWTGHPPSSDRARVLAATNGAIRQVVGTI